MYFLEQREQLSILRSHAPCPAAINKKSPKISSSINEVLMELASGDRAGARSMSSKERS